MSTITYEIKVASGKFTIDDAVAPKLTFRDGDTYVFDQADSSNSGHILKFSATSDNSGSSIYSTGVTIAGTAGNAGASTTVVTSSSTTDTLYYFSAGGSGYGSEFSNTGFKTSTNFNLLKPIVGTSSTAEKWGPMLNHAIDQLDQAVPTDTVGVLPHIIPDVLYPAISGKLLDGTTSHSGAYGTAQTDGRNYFWTSILGSKPIKDPRIGSHFGSQRHKVRSFQMLEEETAMHGTRVSSIDGREWMRMVADLAYEYNGSSGHCIAFETTTEFVEVVGYFNDINVSHTATTNRDFKVSIDGGVEGSVLGAATYASPIGSSRFLDGSSLINCGLSEALGIHTAKIRATGSDGLPLLLFNVELLVQDTTSTATKSKVQIPAQDVVSFGKKHSVSATAQHFDPFNGFTSGNLAAVQALGIDDTTSLGLAKWLHSGSYYRPYNGGRVIKWINSDGEIKTSVTMMPPNAKSIGDSDSITNATAKANASIANNTSYPTFEAHTTSVYEDNLDELAKSFHWREFGNGAANGGTGATYADASMLDTTSDQSAYVLDDGLTSLTGVHCKAAVAGNGYYLLPNADGNLWAITFIGTGISYKTTSNLTLSIAQNLPYGTHVLRVARDADGTADVWIDGIAFADLANTDHGYITDWINISQPKVPPIDQDAVIIGDYMLMADHIVQNDSEDQQISKGVRLCSASRDHFYAGAAPTANVLQAAETGHGFGGLRGCTANASAPTTAKLSFFGTNAQSGGQAMDSAGWAVTLNDAAITEVILDSSNGSFADQIAIADGEKITLSQTNITTSIPNNAYWFFSTCVASPTHTSSHYQTFETPYLFELVGGDRNMEQNNLIVTADGKSWDEVTRNTSYLGNSCLITNTDTGTSYGDGGKFDEWRGTTGTRAINYGNKDFAIAYDRFICLVASQYVISVNIRCAGSTYGVIYKNGVVVIKIDTTAGDLNIAGNVVVHLERGDIINYVGEWNSSIDYSSLEIKRI